MLHYKQDKREELMDLDNTAKNLRPTKKEIDEAAEELIRELGEPTPPKNAIPLEESIERIKKYANL